jgi:4-hydroxy-2-oxoheptanedioate aldolase
LETKQAVKAIDDILSVPGIDAAYVGPADLSISYGLPPASDNPGTVFDEAIDAIVSGCRRHGVTPGVHTVSSLAAKRLGNGFQMLTISADFPALTAAMRADFTTATKPSAPGSTSSTSMY